MAGNARTLTLSAVFAALMAASAYFSVPFFPVPLSLQTFFLYLSVLLLGRRAYAGQLIYLGMGLAGLPVFAKGMGSAALVGPTGGYLFGFLAGAVVAGTFLSIAGSGRRSSCHSIADVLAVSLCIAVVFSLGWIGLVYWTGGDFVNTLWTGVLPFIPGDLLKGALAISVSRRLRGHLQALQ